MFFLTYHFHCKRKRKNSNVSFLYTFFFTHYCVFSINDLQSTVVHSTYVECCPGAAAKGPPSRLEGFLHGVSSKFLYKPQLHPYLLDVACVLSHAKQTDPLKQVGCPTSEAEPAPLGLDPSLPGFHSKAGITRSPTPDIVYSMILDTLTTSLPI